MARPERPGGAILPTSHVAERQRQGGFSSSTRPCQPHCAWRCRRYLLASNPQDREAFLPLGISLWRRQIMAEACMKWRGGDSENRTAPLLLQWYHSRDLWHPVPRIHELDPLKGRPLKKCIEGSRVERRVRGKNGGRSMRPRQKEEIRIWRV